MSCSPFVEQLRLLKPHEESSGLTLLQTKRMRVTAATGAAVAPARAVGGETKWHPGKIQVSAELRSEAVTPVLVGGLLERSNTR